MNVDECIRQGLLVKAARDTEKANASLKAAERKLEIARRGMKAQIFESAVIGAYSAMFHAGRALIFRDGYKERSHYAIWVFLSERYGSSIERKYLNELSSLRLQRHDLLYGLHGPEATEEDAAGAIEAAGGFLARVKKLLA